MLSLIEIPIISAVLFMIAGVLIGYLLWCRDRTADRRALEIAERKVADARQSIRDQKTQLAELQDQTQQSPTPSQPAFGLGIVDAERLAKQTAQLRGVEEENQKLRAEIEHLQNQMDSQSQDIAQQLRKGQLRVEEFAAQKSEQERKLEAQHEQIQKLARDLEAANRINTELQEQTTQNLGRKDDLLIQNDQVQKLTNELENAHRINGELQKAIDEQVTELDALSQQVAASQLTRSEFRASVADLESLQDQLASTEEQLTQAREANETYRRSIEQQDAELLRLRQQRDVAADTNVELTSIQNELDRASLQLRQSQDENQTLREASSQQQTRILQYDGELEDVKRKDAKLQSLSEQLQTSREEKEEIQRNSEQFQLTIQQHVRKLESLEPLTAQLKSAHEQIQETQQENESLKSNLQQQQHELQLYSQQTGTVKVLRSEINVLNERLEAADQENKTLQNNYETQQEKMQRYAQKAESLGAMQVEQQTLTKRLEETEQERVVLADLVNQSQRSLEKYAVQIDELKAREKTLVLRSDKLTDAEGELNILRQRTEQQQTVIDEQSQRLLGFEANQAEVARQADTLTKIRTELDSSQKTIKIQVAEIEMLKSQQTELSSLRKAVDGIVPVRQRLKETVTKLKETETRNQEISEFMQKQSAELQESTRHTTALQKRYDKQNSEFQGLRNQFVELQKQSEQLKQLQKSQELLERNNKSLSDRAKGFDQEVGQLQRVLKETNHKLQEARNAEAVGVKRIKDCEQMIRLLQAEKKQAEQSKLQATKQEQEIRDLSEHLRRVSAEHEASLDANAKIQNRIRELENEVHNSAATIRELRRTRAFAPALKNGKLKPNQNAA